MTTNPSIARYLLLDRAGPQLRLPRLTIGIPPEHRPVVARVQLLTAIAADLGGYPRSLVTPTGGLMFLAVMDNQRPRNESACRLMANLGHDATARGALAICAIRAGEMTSLSRRQIGQLLLRLAYPGWRHRQQPPCTPATGATIPTARGAAS